MRIGPQGQSASYERQTHLRFQGLARRSKAGSQPQSPGASQRDPLMKAILYPFLVLAACGLALSIGAHCMALAEAVIPGGKLVWGLHIGIFVVWLPAVWVSYRLTRHSNQKDFWKVALAGCPLWMRRGLYCLFGYAALNFILFITTPGRAKQTGVAPPAEVRGFSGHWMVFYGAAFATLYSAIHAPYLFDERRCPQGHAVSPIARFCPECGHEFSNEHGNA